MLVLTCYLYTVHISTFNRMADLDFSNFMFKAWLETFVTLQPKRKRNLVLPPAKRKRKMIVTVKMKEKRKDNVSSLSGRKNNTSLTNRNKVCGRRLEWMTAQRFSLKFIPLYFTYWYRNNICCDSENQCDYQLVFSMGKSFKMYCVVWKFQRIFVCLSDIDND